ncbi:hypothetical protein Bbelb_227260 [Branchiostoma belcheri]|nr:hypothetical protein Bbelb_227260 [Branchiostoma belcheri]
MPFWKAAVLCRCVVQGYLSVAKTPVCGTPVWGCVEEQIRVVTTCPPTLVNVYTADYDVTAYKWVYSTVRGLSTQQVSANEGRADPQTVSLADISAEIRC